MLPPPKPFLCPKGNTPSVECSLIVPVPFYPVFPYCHISMIPIARQRCQASGALYNPVEKKKRLYCRVQSLVFVVGAKMKQVEIEPQSATSQ